uniref:Uncharacterized protein n=1 Tax=Lactuca sativa TaxID=4236 RepID=A0A9R1VFT3_LACSA|nr:hypothetical protein LSAT_V11C500242680 [Lactuca sativa]
MYAFGLSLISTSSSVFSLINPSVTVSVNEKKFIESALLSDLRVDGRRPFDYRKLSIIFKRPNEGTLAIYTEFSPMADPSFDSGCLGESAIELWRIVDHGLRYDSLFTCLSFYFSNFWSSGLHLIFFQSCDLHDYIHIWSS